MPENLMNGIFKFKVIDENRILVFVSLLMQ